MMLLHTTVHAQSQVPPEECPPSSQFHSLTIASERHCHDDVQEMQTHTDHLINVRHPHAMYVNHQSFPSGDIMLTRFLHFDLGEHQVTSDLH